MKNGYESNVISLNKIWNNLKKYFWIIIVCVVASLGISFVVAANLNVVIAPVTRNIYGSDAHVMVDWNLEQETPDEATLAFCQENIKVLSKYISSTEFVSFLNTKLNENNYPTLASNERVMYDACSYNMIRIVVCGYAENGRLEFILNASAEILQNEAKELYNVESVKLISEPYLQNVNISNSNYNLVYGSIVDPNQIVTTPTPNNVSLMDKWTQNTNFIIYILSGIIFGAFVLFTIMVFDDKVYTETEINQVLKTTLLGNAKSEGENVLVSEKILGKCKKNNLSNIGAVLLGNSNNSVLAIQEYIQAEGVKFEILEDIEKNADAMKRLSKKENIVIGIELNKVHKSQIAWCLETLEYFGISDIGYFVF